MSKRNNTTDFFEILITLAKHKVFLLKTIIGITLLALIISLVWPKTYLSTSEVIQNRESIGSIGGLLQSFGSISSGQSKVGGETIIVILYSESMKEKLIEKFNLKEVYGATIKEVLFKTLESVITIEEVREGGFGFNPIVSVKIGVEDEDPERAQAMNKFIIEELDNRLQELNEQSAKNNLEIYEQRFEQNKKELLKAEEKLNNFQNKYGILEVPSQLQALIENLAELKSNVIQKEIELEILGNRLGSNSSEIIQKQQELQALRETYNELIQKSNNTDEVEGAFYPLFDMPDLLLTYARLMREVEVQNKVYELLLPQLEQQKMYLANKNSGLVFIDKPDLPTYKNSPKRAFIVIGGFLFAVFFSFLVIYLKELYGDENSEYRSQINRFRKEIKFKKPEN